MSPPFSGSNSDSENLPSTETSFESALGLAFSTVHLSFLDTWFYNCFVISEKFIFSRAVVNSIAL